MFSVQPCVIKTAVNSAPLREKLFGKMRETDRLRIIADGFGYTYRQKMQILYA